MAADDDYDDGSMGADFMDPLFWPTSPASSPSLVQPVLRSDTAASSFVALIPLTVHGDPNAYDNTKYPHTGAGTSHHGRSCEKPLLGSSAAQDGLLTTERGHPASARTSVVAPRASNLDLGPSTGRFSNGGGAGGGRRAVTDTYGDIVFSSKNFRSEPEKQASFGGVLDVGVTVVTRAGSDSSGSLDTMVPHPRMSSISAEIHHHHHPPMNVHQDSNTSEPPSPPPPSITCSEVGASDTPIVLNHLDGQYTHARPDKCSPGSTGGHDSRCSGSTVGSSSCSSSGSWSCSSGSWTGSDGSRCSCDGDPDFPECRRSLRIDTKTSGSRTKNHPFIGEGGGPLPGDGTRSPGHRGSSGSRMTGRPQRTSHGESAAVAGGLSAAGAKTTTMKTAAQELVAIPRPMMGDDDNKGRDDTDATELGRKRSQNHHRHHRHHHRNHHEVAKNTADGPGSRGNDTVPEVRDIVVSTRTPSKGKSWFSSLELKKRKGSEGPPTPAPPGGPPRKSGSFSHRHSHHHHHRDRNGHKNGSNSTHINANNPGGDNSDATGMCKIKIDNTTSGNSNGGGQKLRSGNSKGGSESIAEYGIGASEGTMEPLLGGK